MYIKLTNFQKRTAELFLLSLNGSKTSKRIITTANGQMEPESQAIITRIPGGWTADKKPEQIVEALVKSDPEIDTRLIGKPVRIRSLAYLDEQRKPVCHFRLVEEKLTPEGTVKETRPYKVSESNIELPIQLSPKGSQTTEDLVQKFVLHKIYQVDPPGQSLIRFPLQAVPGDPRHRICPREWRDQGQRAVDPAPGGSPLLRLSARPDRRR